MAHSAERLPFAQLVHRDLDLTSFMDQADRLLGRAVPFEASCWLSLDPDTLLPTSHFSREYGLDQLLDLVKNEFLDEDFNRFADLARAPRPVGTLISATAGEPHRSPRHAGFLGPLGVGDGDELRAGFRDGDAAWGGLAIHRRAGRFSDHEIELIGSIGPLLAQGIRRGILRAAVRREARPDATAIVILAADDSIEGMSPAARGLIDELIDSTSTMASTPMTLLSVAHQARRAGRGATDEVASARLPLRSGGWIRLEASLLDDGERVAVVLSGAPDDSFADVIAQAYGLSSREREVASLTLRGLSTREMAQLLQVSAYTVQDHLKSIFDKVGVRTRGELAAQLFLQQCVPLLPITGAAAAS